MNAQPLTRMDAAVRAGMILGANLNLARVELNTISQMLQVEPEVRVLEKQLEELQLERQFKDMLDLGRSTEPSPQELQVLSALTQRQILLVQLQQGFAFSADQRELQGIIA